MTATCRGWSFSLFTFSFCALLNRKRLEAKTVKRRAVAADGHPHTAKMECVLYRRNYRMSVENRNFSGDLLRRRHWWAPSAAGNIT